MMKKSEEEKLEKSLTEFFTIRNDPNDSIINNESEKIQIVVTSGSAKKKISKTNRWNRPEISNATDNGQNIQHQSSSKDTNVVKSSPAMADYGHSSHQIYAQKNKAKKNETEVNATNKNIKKLPDSFRFTMTLRSQKIACLKYDISPEFKDNAKNKLIVTTCKFKGKCLRNTHTFEPLEAVCLYEGERIDQNEMLNRFYLMNERRKERLFFVDKKSTEKSYYIDVTERYSYSLAQFMNHTCRHHANVQPKLMEINGKEEIIFIATEKIEPFTELVWQYTEKPQKEIPYSFCFCRNERIQLSRCIPQCICAWKSCYSNDLQRKPIKFATEHPRDILKEDRITMKNIPNELFDLSSNESSPNFMRTFFAKVNDDKERTRWIKMLQKGCIFVTSMLVEDFVSLCNVDFEKIILPSDEDWCYLVDLMTKNQHLFDRVMELDNDWKELTEEKLLQEPKGPNAEIGIFHYLMAKMKGGIRFPYNWPPSNLGICDCICCKESMMLPTETGITEELIEFELPDLPRSDGSEIEKYVAPIGKPALPFHFATSDFMSIVSSDTNVIKAVKQLEKESLNVDKEKRKLKEILMEFLALEDMKRLNDGIWLNANLMDFYLFMIRERHSEIPIEVIPTYALLSSKKKIPRQWYWNLETTKLVFAPVHLSESHWCMNMVNIPGRSIIIMDSLNDGTTSQAKKDSMKTLLKILMDIAVQQKANIGLEIEWKLEEDFTVPSQENLDDCGVFALSYALYRANDEPMNFSQEHTPYFRRQFCKEICDRIGQWYQAKQELPNIHVESGNCDNQQDGKVKTKEENDKEVDVSIAFDDDIHTYNAVKSPKRLHEEEKSRLKVEKWLEKSLNRITTKKLF